MQLPFDPAPGPLPADPTLPDPPPALPSPASPMAEIGWWVGALIAVALVAVLLVGASLLDKVLSTGTPPPPPPAPTSPQGPAVGYRPIPAGISLPDSIKWSAVTIGWR